MKFGKTIVFVGGLALGYLANSVFTGPQRLQERLETKVSENPAGYESVVKRGFDFGYDGWVEAQKAKGVKVDLVQGIEPTLYVDPNTGAGVGIADLANAKKDGKPVVYGARRISSDLANQLGTNLACGSAEQSVDQFVGTVAQNPDVLNNYPGGKREIIQSYAFAGLKSEAKGLYERVKSWIAR